MPLSLRPVALALHSANKVSQLLVWLSVEKEREVSKGVLEKRKMRSQAGNNLVLYNDR